ncbi:kinase-like domain-containing protein [Cladorrhinum samala]|uniref:Kinase-like domain-containing protein n=1 Tax=Cladorrhinum samala TaxID=585594 RepID=A0AAV9HF88_9PEZI|nr:kinase-like domain-containing protein [Cladorrhinum samala]
MTASTFSISSLTPLNMEMGTIEDDLWNIIITNQNNAFSGRGWVSSDKLDELLRERQRDIQRLCGIDDDGLEELNGVIRIVFTLIHFSKLNQTTYRAIRDMNMTDDHLPVRYEKSPTHLFLSEARIIEDRQRSQETITPFLENRSDCERFANEQFYFWVPSFGKGEYSDLDGRCNLPIYVIQKSVSSGSFGDVSKVKVHHAHLKSEDPETPVTEENNPVLALKILKADSQQEFDQERVALSKLQHCKNPHLITLIASFKRGTDFHFLFPWAEGGDLRSFWEQSWEKHGFKQQREGISWALGQMIGIAKAVEDLHKVQPRDDLGGAKENCRHGDLRPENILAFGDKKSNGDVVWRLCITDAGLAKFHERITNERITGTTTTRGSIEYAPPESRVEDRNKPRSRVYDMWSLGCIFLEFAIWLVGGSAAVDKSRHKRFKEDQYQAYHRKGKLRSQVKDDISLIRTKGFRKLADIIEDKLLVEERKRIGASGLVAALEDWVVKNPSLPVIVDGSDRESGAPLPNQELVDGGGRRRKRDALVALASRFRHQ